MIPQITEINFPKYATLSTATATLVDMGDKTITTQVKIDGSIVPDFSYDWEIEFQGERYIHPLREPQASKSNESISSVIDLTFYHKGIYDLKRHFFVSTAETEAGTIMADNYIVPLAMNIGKFVEALNKVLKLYYGNTYLVDLNPEYEYDETDIKYIDINYTKIWDIFTHFYEWFGVRWTLGTHDAGDDFIYYTFKVGYPAQEVSHIFQYGFEGGLLKFERQVQDAEIRNQMFGRGGSQNLPYRYFKNVDPNNPDWKADPDWIPELASIYFSELRGKSFRDYVRGWKAKHYGGQSYFPTTDAYIKGYTDEQFNPVDYVEDKDSIAKYGLIQGGLDNNEEIFPTIQKRVIEGLGRADEVVDVETILVDEPTSNTEAMAKILEISEDKIHIENSDIKNKTYTIKSSNYQIPYGYKGHFIEDIGLSASENVVGTLIEYYGNGQSEVKDAIYDAYPLSLEIVSYRIVDATTNLDLVEIVNIPDTTTFYVEAEVKVSGFVQAFNDVVDDPWAGEIGRELRLDPTCQVIVSLKWDVDYTPIHGIILGNYTEGVNRISGNVSVSANGTGRVELFTEIFEVDEDGTTNVDVPTRITSSDTTGSYSPRKIIDAINVDTNEAFDPSNLSEGRYRLRVITDITNLSTASQTYKVELLPAYIYYPYDSAKWRPTFDIWIKDIWGSTRLDDENDTSYADRIWIPILGDRKGEEAKVVFSSGSLSGYSDWEFPIVAYAFDDSKSLDGVPSHWRLTLAKSDAEVDASGKWIPSIQTQAHAGDHFYFIGIDMPHQYVLWAEEEVDKWKRENMPSQIKPAFVIQTDKVRLNELQEGETRPLLNSLRIGNSIRLADFRFIKGKYGKCYDVDGKQLYDVDDKLLMVIVNENESVSLQSVTYTWDASTIMLPNIEVVLSDKVIKIDKPYRDTNLLLSDIKVSLSETKAQLDKFKKTSKKNELTAKTASSQANRASIIASEANTTASRSLTEVNSLTYVKRALSETEAFGESVVVSKGVFEGIIKHQIVSITKPELNSILPPSEATMRSYTRYRMSPMLMSSIMDINNAIVSADEEDYFTSTDSITFVMPVLYGYTLYDADSIANETELRSLVGTRFIVYNNTPALVHFCGKRYYSDTKTFDEQDICYKDWVVGEGYFATVECKLELDNENREVIYWDIKVGKHK